MELEQARCTRTLLVDDELYGEDRCKGDGGEHDDRAEAGGEDDDGTVVHTNAICVGGQNERHERQV